MKITYVKFLIFTLFLIPHILNAQNLLQTNDVEKIRNDTTPLELGHYYKPAEIAFELENINRYINTSQKEIDLYRIVADIDTSFSRLSKNLNKDFDDFNNFNKQNLSKFFLLNTRRFWLSYRTQLNNWQTDISSRIKNLMQVSENIKSKEKLWNATLNLAVENRLPAEMISRIQKVINDLNDLESSLYGVVGNLAVLDSRLSDQIMALDLHIQIIDDLHKNYRVNILKATQPAIWNIKLKNAYEGSVKSRLLKAWYENTKSIKESLPSYKGYIDNFLIWSLLIIIAIVSLKFFYLKKVNANRSVKGNSIKELIVNKTGVSILFMVLFVFALLFKNLPLAFSGIILLLILIVTYLLLIQYLSDYGRKLIVVFIVLLLANTAEIIYWYFGDYARLYILFEAGLGITLFLPFMRQSRKMNVIPGFRYRIIIDIVSYTVFSLYTIALIANVFGFQNLSVLFLKIGTGVIALIIIIVGAKEIGKSALYVLFEILAQIKKLKSKKHLALLKSRINLFLNLIFFLIWFRTFLAIVELDTPFNEMVGRMMDAERNIGSFIYTYGAIFQFVIIILITWGLTSIIKIILSEKNFKKTQQLRGVPAAISITLRLIVVVVGFLLALSGAGIDLTKISILIGAFGVGIGFGLQNIVNNFISGLILIYERPIQAGDTIELNTLLGEVKSIGIRSSNVRTFDGAEVIVPNSLLVSDQLINWTLSDEKRRIEILVGVKYGTNPSKVIQVLKQVANDNDLVEKNPEPQVLFKEFADSSLNFRLLCWGLFRNWIQIKSDLSVAIEKAFKENNIEIPFPQLDLHVIESNIDLETKKKSDIENDDMKPTITEDS